MSNHSKAENVYSLNSESMSKTMAEIKAKFKSAATPTEIASLIEQIDSTVSQIDTTLHNYTTLNRQRLQQDITNIESLRTSKLSPTITESAALLNIFAAADELGHQLTFKIKSLDEEIGNVNKTLKYVEDMQLLKTNINQISYAIEHKNWESAARCIHTIQTKIPKELISSEFASVVIPSTEIPELPQMSIAKWTDQLTEVFKSQFTDAAKRRDVEKLTMYFQLFPLLEKEEVGLTCYAKFICEIINESSKNLTSTVNNIHSNDLKPGIFSIVTMQLFENVSMMLSQHGPLIKKYYISTYPDALTFVINKLQREVDLQIGIIADTFYDARRLEKVFQDIELYSFPILSKRLKETHEHEPSAMNNEDVADDEFLPIRFIGDLCSELSSILQSWSLYCKFIAIKYFNTSSDSGLPVPEIILKSNFTKKVNEKLLPSFEKLYRFYFRRSFEKSISIEELPSLEPYLLVTSTSTSTSTTKSKSPEQVPVSSVVEDLTLILNNTLRNAIHSGFPSAVKSFIVEAFNVVQQDLINGFFIKNLNENSPKYNHALTLITPETKESNVAGPGGLTSPRGSRSGTPEPISNARFFRGASSAFESVVSGSGAIVGSLQTMSTGNSTRLMNFIVYLNSIGVAQEYFNKVVNNIINSKDNGALIHSSFPFNKDSEKIVVIISQDFLSPFERVTGKILNESVINLYNQSIKQRLSILISELITDASNSNYILHSSSQINDPSILISFKSNWSSITKPYLQTLHPSIWNRLLRLIVVNLASLIERRLHSVLKRFQINEMGAIKLEKDLSFVINEVCQDNYHLREKFVRLTQLVLLVSMDDDEYEESSEPDLTHAEKEQSPKTDDGDGDEEMGGINWVLTPHERDQIRQYRA
ncbi:uncharacterized protein LODBEIA_P01010 [Lodderomyces beijingensis]|uniref:Conserved oligomeric Golgi complex subunit 4 n=1 Tax=Lodderomyces beijingensis TaxID=1775926 RepID=A0ABP0ZCG2_9ASCO